MKRAPQIPKREVGEPNGDDVVRCHVMLKVLFKVMLTILTDVVL